MGEIKIGKHIAVQRPIKVPELNFDKDGRELIYLNSKGERIKKQQILKGEYKWINVVSGKEETGKAYKSLNGKPVKEFGKTKDIKEVIVADIKDKDDMIENEATYQLISAPLKAELQGLAKENKTLSFKYVNAGFKVYKAFLELRGENILMRCFRGNLNNVDLSAGIGSEELTAQEDGVERMDLSEIDV